MIKRAEAHFDREWTHIRLGQTWAAQHDKDDDVAASLCNNYGQAGSLKPADPPTGGNRGRSRRQSQPVKRHFEYGKYRVLQTVP